jgi:ABC-type dipeptide/oligopeptide/nickel transport system permease subunit
MRRQARLTKGITAKVTDADYRRIEKAAGQQTVSEWARAALLKAAEGPDPLSALAAEQRAVNYILINALPFLPAGQRAIETEVGKLINDAKQGLAKPILEQGQ